MSNKDPLPYAFFGLAAGIGIFFWGFGVRRRYKTIESTPTSRVRSVAVGLVEIHGRAEIENMPLRSPFSQLDCVYYSYNVEERRKSGKRHTWVTIAKFQSSQPYRVRDETGSILILPKDAECTFRVDNNYRMSFFSDANEESFKAGLERIGIPHSNLFGERPLRCSETYILPGDELFVLGTATPRSFSESSERNEDNLFIAKGSKGALFIMADRSEKELLSSLWWQMCAMIFLGPVLAVSCFWYILHRFHYL
ncbi:MAG: E3 ubiquitin ligase family protein [Oligoflexia bacterium]|nr:E3 ubiquitin ligase family protein [Oligoflexia bacterium]